MKKIKGNKGINSKLLLWIAVCVCALLTTLRFIQVNSLIEPETGFFSGTSPLNYIPYIIICCSFAGFFVLSLLSKDANGFKGTGYKSKASIITLFAALGFIADAVNSALSGFSASAADTQASATVIKVGSSVRVIFACLSAAYFFILFADERKGGEKAQKRKALVLSPAIWAAARLVLMFTAKISYVRVSDLLLQLAYLCFFALFFLYFAQHRSSVYSEGTTWKMFAYGLTATVIALPVMLNRLLFMFIDGGEKLLADYPFLIADLINSLFVLSFLFGKKEYIAQSETIEQPQSEQTVQKADNTDKE